MMHGRAGGKLNWSCNEDSACDFRFLKQGNHSSRDMMSVRQDFSALDRQTDPAEALQSHACLLH